MKVFSISIVLITMLTACSKELQNNDCVSNKETGLKELYNNELSQTKSKFNYMMNSLKSRSSYTIQDIQDLLLLPDEEFEFLVKNTSLSNSIDEIYEFSIEQLSKKLTSEEIILLENLMEDYAMHGLSEYEFVATGSENFSQAAKEVSVSVAGKIDGIMPVDNGRIILSSSSCRDMLYVKLVEIGVASYICDEIYGLSGVSGALPDILTSAADMTAVIGALKEYKRCNGGKW